MADRFLVPCSCGRRIPAELRQAGQEIACSCGQRVTVPPLLALRRLELAPLDDDAPEKPSRWGMGQRVAVIGLLLLLPALAYGGYLLAYWPNAPYTNLDVDGYRRAIERSSPLSTWHMYQSMRADGLNPLDPRDQEAYEQSVLRSQIALGLSIFVAVTGIAVLIIALMICLGARRQPSR